MTEIDFFQEVAHTLVPWQGYHLHVPVFYDEIRSMMLTFLVPTEKVKAELPGNRLHPMPVMPGKAAVSISVYEYRDSDIGPYNEVIVGIPVSLDKPLPLFTGSFRKAPLPLMVYIHTIPVTTEIARKVGVDFAGYPKFIAQIDFTEEQDWLTCQWLIEGALVLSLKGRKLSGRKVPRFRSAPITNRNGYFLRSEMVISEREIGRSRQKEDVVFSWGDHPLAGELKQMGLEIPSSYSYSPQYRGILTPVFESFKV